MSNDQTYKTYHVTHMSPFSEFWQDENGAVVFFGCCDLNEPIMLDGAVWGQKIPYLVWYDQFGDPNLTFVVDGADFEFPIGLQVDVKTIVDSLNDSVSKFVFDSAAVRVCLSFMEVAYPRKMENLSSFFDADSNSPHALDSQGNIIDIYDQNVSEPVTVASFQSILLMPGGMKNNMCVSGDFTDFSGKKTPGCLFVGRYYKEMRE